MRTDFIALDVETANAELESIGQIGAVIFSDGEITSSWQTLVDPEDYFDPINVLIHGIDEHAVSNAPRFPDVAGELKNMLSGKIVAIHTGFDKLAISRAEKKYGIPQTKCAWFDTAQVCRRAWKRFSIRGYGLREVSDWCGIEFRHHDAKEDARAAGFVLLRAIADTGLSIDDWSTRITQPLDPLRGQRQGKPEGSLYGEVAVFTGVLSIQRREASDLAANAGCDVDRLVTRRTTILVVGDQDIRKLAGSNKSSKHRKALKLATEGYPIRILSESDFFRLVEH